MPAPQISCELFDNSYKHIDASTNDQFKSTLAQFERRIRIRSIRAKNLSANKHFPPVVVRFHIAAAIAMTRRLLLIIFLLHLLLLCIVVVAILLCCRATQLHDMLWKLLAKWEFLFCISWRSRSGNVSYLSKVHSLVDKRKISFTLCGE